MKHYASTFFTSICLFITCFCFGQVEVIYQQETGPASNVAATTPDTELGNYISLAGTNRMLTKISPVISFSGNDVGTANYTIKFWSECPATGDLNSAGCGDNGAVLYYGITRPLNLTGIPFSFELVDFPLPYPVNFNDILSDSIYVTFSVDRPQETSFAWSDFEPTIGEALTNSISVCGNNTNNGCNFGFGTGLKSNFLFGLHAVPYPLIPDTIELSNILNQTATANLSVSDVYIGDANYVPTQSITLSKTSFTCADLGDNLVEATVTFPNGQVGFYQTNVFVRDVSPPTLVTPFPNFSETAAPGECGAIVVTNELFFAQWDNCTSFTAEHFSGPPSGSFFPIGTTTCVHLYTDASGNQTFDTYFVTVLPNPADDTDTDLDGIVDVCDMCQGTSDVSLNFNRAGNNYVSIPHNNALNFTGSNFSFEAWVKPDIFTQHAIVSKGTGTNSSTLYAYNIDADGRQSLGIGGSTTFTLEWTFSDLKVPLGQWSHVAVTLDKSGPNPVAIFYLNGEPSSPKTFALSSTELYDFDFFTAQIGKQGFSTVTPGYFDGSIDELGMWSRVLTEAEINTSIGSAYSGNESNLVAYYNFNDANACVENSSNTTLIDYTNNGHNGSLQNFVLGASCSSNWSSGYDGLEPVVALCKDLNIEASPGTVLIFSSDIDNGSFSNCGFLQSIQSINGVSSIELDISTEGLHYATLGIVNEGGDFATCEAEINVIADLCPEGDDAIDSDNGGLPDACDCSPLDASNDGAIINNIQNAGMDFDGIDDYLTTLANSEITPSTISSMTFEAWIKPSPSSGINSIAYSGDSPTNYNLDIFFFQGKIYVSAKNNTTLISNNLIPISQWTHIAVTFENDSVTPANSEIRIYVNGQLDNSLTTAFEPYLGAPIIIGKSQSFQPEYFGQMEEIRFWNVAKTESQINLIKDRELYGTEDNLALYYNFSEGIPEGDNADLSVVQDFSTNGVDADLSGFALTGITSNWINAKEIDLKIVKRESLVPCFECPQNISMDFDGVDDHILLPHDPLLVPTATNPLTFETWIYPENVTDIGIISSSGIFPNINYLIYIFEDNILVTGEDVGALISTSNIPLAQWTHIAVVFDQTETKLYINGVLDNTRIQTLSSNVQVFATGIGAQADGLPTDWNFEGKMDETKFWNEARTASQIIENMNSLNSSQNNLLAYYNFNDGLPGGDNSGTNVVTDLSSFNRDGNLMGFAKVGANSNWVNSDLSEGNENVALHFDGIDDLLRMSNNPDLIPIDSNSITIEGWIYPERISGASTIISSGDFPNFNHQISLFDSTLFVSSPNSGSNLLSQTNVPPFKWTHFAVVYEATKTRLYINGVLDNTGAGIVLNTNLGSDLTWGSQDNGIFGNFLGKMDDLKIWDHPRAQHEIIDVIKNGVMGEEPGLLAYYNFNKGVPGSNNTGITIIEDQSPSGNDLTINNFEQTGMTSNWTSSSVRALDIDKDGREDLCDNCIAKESLTLQNIALDGTYRAKETIILGEGLVFPSSGILNFIAPTLIVPDDLDIPLGPTVNVIQETCVD